MIVVDTNVIAALFVRGPQTKAARAVLARDPEWAAPPLWRSEFRSVLTGAARLGRMDWDTAAQIMALAEGLLGGLERPVPSPDVLALAQTSRCTAYDCEFAALARRLSVPLVTLDRELLAGFPDFAVTPEAFLAT